MIAASVCVTNITKSKDYLKENGPWPNLQFHEAST
jgi:hypothetical protein